MSDPLADWWIHQVSVKRSTGDKGYSGGFAPVETVTGLYSDRTEYNADGSIRANGRFAFPAAVDYIPVESQVTLPPQFGTLPGGALRTASVVYTIVADGGPDTPNHQVVGLM